MCSSITAPGRMHLTRTALHDAYHSIGAAAGTRMFTTLSSMASTAHHKDTGGCGRVDCIHRSVISSIILSSQSRCVARLRMPSGNVYTSRKNPEGCPRASALARMTIIVRSLATGARVVSLALLFTGAFVSLLIWKEKSVPPSPSR